MTQSEQLANRLREVVLDGQWIANTNFKQELENLDWQKAIQPVSSTNSIAALAQHIHYYIAGILEAMQTGELRIRDRFSFEFPPVESHEQWNDFLLRFWNDAETLASLVEGLSEEQLMEDFIHPKYGSVRRNIDAMIEHGYYHLGQVVLLKKWVDHV